MQKCLSLSDTCRQMAKGTRKYRLNPQTLLYEADRVSLGTRLSWIVGFVCGSLLLAFFWFWVYSSVLGLEPPKTVLLKKRNARWASLVEQMDRRLDADQTTLEGLRIRDDEIYRNIFGMNPVAPETRDAGFGGVNRYAYLDGIPESSPLRKTALRLDRLTKQAYVQSKSFDDVDALSRRAGDMASCIPLIIPVNPDPSKYRLTSPFGYRSDPINGQTKFHSGLDFAMDQGNPIYAAGDGVVKTVSNELYGYGNSVIIDHGFGYETRYAHMKIIYVVEGMKVKRGECLGESGRSGKVTGPHLHYEVFYRGDHVNPMDYIDLDMSTEEYMTMVRKVEQESRNVLNKPFERIR